MTFHTPLGQVVDPRSDRLTPLDLLDCCRCAAAARLSGSPRLADEALEYLLARVPRDEAYRQFGLIHALVAGAMARPGEPFRWHPPGATRFTEDERILLSETLERHVGAAAGCILPVERLEETLCAAEGKPCGLHAAVGAPCGGGCLFGDREDRRR